MAIPVDPNTIILPNTDPAIAGYGQAVAGASAVYITENIIYQSGGGQAAGSEGQIQINTGGQLSGDSGLSFNPNSDSLTVGGVLRARAVSTDSFLYSNGAPVSFNSLGNGISNGTSNISIPTTNGNVVTTVGGTAILNVTSQGANITGNLNVTGNITNSLLPSANVTYDLGSPTQRWRDIYLSNNTIYLGNTQLTSTDGNTLSVGNQTIAPTIIPNEFHVTPIGNDTYGDGTVTNPFATVGKAANVAANNSINGHYSVVIVHPGFYEEDITIDNPNPNTSNLSIAIVGVEQGYNSYSTTIRGNLTFGPGVIYTQLSSLTLGNVIVQQNQHQGGGDFTMLNCAIQNNFSVTGNSKVTVNGCQMYTTGNTIIGYSNLYSNYVDIINTVANNIIINRANTSGVRLDGVKLADLTINEGNFRSGETATISIKNSDIQGNFVYNIANYNATIQIADSFIHSNSNINVKGSMWITGTEFNYNNVTLNVQPSTVVNFSDAGNITTMNITSQDTSFIEFNNSIFNNVISNCSGFLTFGSSKIIQSFEKNGPGNIFMESTLIYNPVFNGANAERRETRVLDSIFYNTLIDNRYEDVHFNGGLYYDTTVNQGWLRFNGVDFYQQSANYPLTTGNTSSTANTLIFGLGAGFLEASANAPIVAANFTNSSYYLSSVQIDYANSIFTGAVQVPELFARAYSTSIQTNSLEVTGNVIGNLNLAGRTTIANLQATVTANSDSISGNLVTLTINGVEYQLLAK